MSKTDLEKGAKSEGNWGPQGTPKSVQNQAKSDANGSRRGSRTPLEKNVEKDTVCRAHWAAKMRLPLKRELNFHFSIGFPESSQKGSQKEAKMGSKSAPGLSGSAFRASLKFLQKLSRK